MFAQIIIGKVADPEEFKERMWTWETELAPKATGWLGSTTGLTKDNICCAVAMFESEAAARDNSTSPDQHQWWVETEKTFHAAPTFYDCKQASTYLDGPAPKAGFVQVMVGKAKRPEEFLTMPPQAASMLRKHRPDLIGGVSGIAGGTAIEIAYFTNEKETRAAERKMAESPTPDVKKLKEMYDETFAVSTYYDLSDPKHMIAKK